MDSAFNLLHVGSVVTTLIMYLACTKCKHGDNKALLISSLSQFLEEQLAKGPWMLCRGVG